MKRPDDTDDARDVACPLIRFTIGDTQTTVYPELHNWRCVPVHDVLLWYCTRCRTSVTESLP